MAINQSGIPTVRNGNQVIAFMGQKDVDKYFRGYMDNASLHSWYSEDPINNHQGLMQFWNNQAPNQVRPIYDDLVSSKSIIEVNGWESSFTFDVPIEKDRGCYTDKDMSHQQYAGIDGAVFYISLNKEFSPGQTLTYDSFDGQQLIVDDSEEVQDTGTGFIHPVQLVSNDRNEYFQSYKLAKGVQYFAIGHGVSEYGTKFAKLQMPDVVGSMKLEYRLGSVRGVEAYFTGMADSKNLGGAVAASKDYLNEIQNEMDSYGYGDFAVRMDIGANGKPNFGSSNIGSTIEYLVQKQLNKLTGTQILFQKAATIKSSNGVIRLNEGLWHQLRRGFIIKYGKPGGITQLHLKQGAEYIFRLNPDLEYEKRRIKFKCGTQAFENMIELFQKEINEQMGNIAAFLGSERQIPNNVEGKDLTNLSWKPVRFTSVYIPQLGQVEIERDPSLDKGLMQDRFSEGMHGNQRAHTTHSMIIWDATNQLYSNNTQDLPKGTSLVEGGNKNANVFIVKPQGNMMYSGQINGRYDSKKSSDIIASHKTMAQEYWAYNNCSVWVKDVSRFVMIELEKSERKGFN